MVFLYLSEKALVYGCSPKNISHSLLVTQFYFSILHNIIFSFQLAFVFDYFCTRYSYNLNKSLLGELDSWATVSFFWLLKHSVFILPLSLTQSVRPLWVLHHSLCSTYVAYGMPCHIIVTRFFALNPYLGKQKIHLGMTKRAVIQESFIKFDE